jgi:predicted nucleic acid-binding protein
VIPVSDANLLIYAVNKDSDFHEKALHFMVYICFVIHYVRLLKTAFKRAGEGAQCRIVFVFYAPEASVEQ